jgi:peptide/nickel transport system permease protein
MSTVELMRVRRRAIARLAPAWSTRIAALLVALLVSVALFGPWLAPHGPSELAGIPYTGSTQAFPFGTDTLGRDVLSRVLWGGRSLLLLAGLATVLGYVIGTSIGLLAGYSRTLLDPLLMRTVDLLLAFPPLLFLLLLVASIGPGPMALATGVTLVHVPTVARIVRAATLEISVREYIEAAVARGEPARVILSREILPNIANSLAAAFGPGLTYSILLTAALSFLGLGLQPPSADWALMISENKSGMILQPLAVAVPAALIALLTVGVSLAADGFARSFGSGSEGGTPTRSPRA